MFRNEPIHLCGRHSHPWSPNLIDPPARRSSPSRRRPPCPRRTIPWWRRGPLTLLDRPNDRAISLGGPFFMPSAPSVVLDERAARSPYKKAMLARSVSLRFLSRADCRWMEVSYSIVETRRAMKRSLINPHSFSSHSSSTPAVFFAVSPSLLDDDRVSVIPSVSLDPSSVEWMALLIGA